MKTIGIIGSRRRNTGKDFLAVRTAFEKIYQDGDHIVSGGCTKGGDKFAEVLAKRMQIPIMIHYAQWDMHGKAAGFIRNADIAKDADIMIACVAEDRTGGTEDTLKKFKEGEVILI